MEVKKTFGLGRMNKEVDNRLIQDGEYRHAENLRFHTNGGKDGVGQNIKGTTLVADLTDGNSDFKCVGAYYNEDLDRLYYFLATEDGAISKICEFNVADQTSSVIAHDNTSILNLQKNGYITGIDEIDGLLYWSEWGNNPRRLNVERAKGYGLNGYTEDDIMVAVMPPLDKLKLTLQLTESEEENYLEEKMFAFSWQYRYLDGEYSTLAPFTEFAFFPEDFNYDFSEQSNRSMVNKFNSVLIEFNTGNERVTEIRLVFKESESNTEWIIDDFNKEKLGYGDNETQSFVFTNNKRYRALSNNVLPNFQNNVPNTVKSQAIIDGRLIYGYYKEGYDIVDDLGNKIEIDYSLNLIATTNTITVEGEEVPSLVPKRTVKSIRDYEVGIIYTDAHGRGTIVLVSKTNTLNIPIQNAVTQNQIQVELNHKPPAFATNYRFFIKPSKKAYDQILPTLFYEDGVYRWIKLEGADKDKIKEGDYLIIKSDSQGILETLVKTKVLEIKTQLKNFLEPENVVDSIKEKAGLYFKIKPKNFRLDLVDFNSFSLETLNVGAKKGFTELDSYIDDPHFYGDTLDDLTSSGTYTGALGEKTRYVIQIDGLLAGGGGEDTFRWSDDNGANWNFEDVVITGAPQLLNNGVSVTFANTVGHSLFDNWTINARASFDASGLYSYGFFRIVKKYDETLSDINEEKIYNGSRLDLVYRETGATEYNFEINNTSSGTYDNIQEWFEEENIFDEINSQVPDFTFDDFYFVKGILRKEDGSDFLEQALDGITTMVVRSVSPSPYKVTQANTDFIGSGDSKTVIFETEPEDQPAEIFYEIGKTYAIEDGVHKADLTLFPTDQHQTDLLPLKATLYWFNAFSYGNAVESYKIKDEFNRKGLDTGIRVLSTIKDEYKEVTRKSDVTWSDIYEDELSFNGLSSFNAAMVNWTKLDQEDGSIQKLLNANGNLVVFQEDSIGMMPYNKNVIYDTQGGSVVGITQNVLDKNSYRPYAEGVYGTSNPESIVQFGNRKYFVDKMRGILGRLSTDGITPISEVAFENYFSNLMTTNKNAFLIGGYDPKHSEYLLAVNIGEGESALNHTLAFKEKKGFPLFFTYKADFMLYADKELYLWKAGKLYLANSSATRNNFFGTQYNSKLTTVINTEAGDDKIYKNVFIESNDAWDVTLATNLANGTIAKEEFIKKESIYHAHTRRNENENDFHGGAVQGIGNIESVLGNNITVGVAPELVNIGSKLFQVNDETPEEIGTITAIDGKIISVLQTGVAPIIGLFCFEKKNSRVEGGDIRGYYMEVTLENDNTGPVELFAVGSNIIKSHP